MSIATLNLDELKRHIGARQTAADVVTAAPANLLRLAFDRPEPEFRDGDVLPAGWHILYFLPRYRPGELREDGAAAGSGVIPAMPLPRRMFAGQTFRFHRPLRVGQQIRQETELTDISAKAGGTGTLVFATVRSSIYGPEGLAIEDERRTVFREEVKAGEQNQAPRREPVPTDLPWKRTLTPDPVLLFRFSALTFNSHRIHYDYKWVTEVEGYPALVVHGPLTATLLIDFVRDSNPGRTITSFSTQARAPLFEGAPLELRGRPVGLGGPTAKDPQTPSAKGGEVWAVTPGGTIGMSAQAELS
jgi:3-methylfumaryl-CoA hydratase